MDKTWFAKLDIELKEEANTNQIKQILIKCPSPFVKDWIKTNYDHEIESAVKQLAELKEARQITALGEENMSETEAGARISELKTFLPIALNPGNIKSMGFEYEAY